MLIDKKMISQMKKIYVMINGNKSFLKKIIDSMGDESYETKR